MKTTPIYAGNRMIVLFCFLILIGSEANLAAQTQSGPVLHLTVAETIRLALANGTGPRLAAANEERARAQMARAKGALLPETEARLLRYSQSINLETFGFSFPGQPPVVGPFNVTDAQISAAMQLFNLAAFRTYRAAQRGVTASRYEHDEAESDMAASAARLYVLAQRSEAAVAIREANVTLFEDLRRLAADQLQAGTGIRLDVARAELQLLRERQALLVATNQRDSARLALLHVIGADQGSQIVFGDSVHPPAEVPHADQAIAAAFHDRAAIKEADVRREQAHYLMAAARFSRLPTLGIDFLGDMSGNKSDDLRWSRRIGAGLSIPILTGGRVTARIAEAKAAELDAETKSNELRRSVEEDVRRGLLDLDSALARVTVANEGIKLSDEELTVARDRLTNGVGTSLEVDRAQDSYRQAREDLNVAEADAAIAGINLERATGAIRQRVQEAAAP